ncbi:unnamed protein product [marine sediment metagenome]|uniref:Uncharacterized protein n=1 Tax=marine sediment metagenome TaxID=412755 RepID=X1TQR4_9ZZZZ
MKALILGYTFVFSIGIYMCAILVDINRAEDARWKQIVTTAELHYKLLQNSYDICMESL